MKNNLHSHVNGVAHGGFGPVLGPANPVDGFFTHRAQCLPIGPKPWLPLQPDRIFVSQSLPPAVQAILEKPVSYFKELARLQPAAGAAPLTQVAFVLDRSSSMMTGKSSTIEGFNNQVNVVRKGAAAAGETRFTEVQFGNSAEVRCVAAPLEQLRPLDDASYAPDGMTALYDALGLTIASLLATEGINNPSTASLVTVFTDGEENYSKQYTAFVLKELIERLEATGRWTFALVGPTGSVGTLANILSIRAGNVASYNPSSLAERTQVFGAVGAASANFMSLRSAGMTQSACLYGEPTQK